MSDKLLFSVFWTDDEKLMLQFLLSHGYDSCGTVIELSDETKCKAIVESIAIKLGIDLIKRSLNNEYQQNDLQD